MKSDKRFLKLRFLEVPLTQIMNYHEWPYPRGNGQNYYIHPDLGELGMQFNNPSIIYDWLIMPDAAANDNSPGSLEAAELCYHAGLATNVEYGYSGTGTSDLNGALNRFFNYSTSNKLRKSNFASQSMWLDSLIAEISENFFVSIIINFPIDSTLLEDIINNSILMQNAILQFQVTSESDYKQYLEIINHYTIQNSVVKPLFIGNNLDFFKHHVFLDKEDILSQQLSFKEIFARRLFSSKFGEIYIEPNGDIYLGDYVKVYGNINDESIATIVNNAINAPECYWFRTKKMVQPCKKCLYQDLCPQTSNYEIVCKRYNLCNVIMENNHA